ncbi:MAG: alpha-amylase family glycosyl hydrolase [Bacteriovoracaceae bacterium]
MPGSKPIISISSLRYPLFFGYHSDSCFEFHISKYSRMKYRVDEVLLESTGNVIFPNFRVVRELAYSINFTRGVLGNTDKEVRAGFLNAVGLLDEIGHFLVRMYDEQENPGVIKRAYQHAESVLGNEAMEKTILQFIKDFPPKAVYKDLQTEKAYFESVTSNRPHKEIALEELMMLHLANINPANKKIKELFDDTNLIARSKYIPLIAELDKFFAKEKPFGPESLQLMDALKKPILEYPENIEAQLGYFKERWGIILSTKFIERINSSAEFSKEEEKFIWHAFNPVGATPNVETFVPEYKKQRILTPDKRSELQLRGEIRPEDYVYAEPEQFTPDSDWMPNVVLIAKNTYVWLDQLSKKYSKEIKRLDQIPDEELDQLARWNFTSLWLIGVWERSAASKRIKQITGNLDAVSSAYSLYDYEIAADIGGETSFQNLNHRCLQRGIRLAGDMVPNHMGIYSKWVLEHPEYFIQSEYSPYPNYRFTGENLSHDQNIELRIEDGYWNRNDAAVVFQRIDRRNGDVRYFYHGNDGTSMPWNDTAQLNLLRADVREAVIQSIFHVARKFSVIRFDAAMTLAKKHFQRLWYPMPGTSGVPSRQDHSLSRTEFDAMFPNEFWREVVDRFNVEMPQTLLLAEAFWLMEGYFVRTLGMHRVYNSAFMHMLMKEENQKFRAMIKNTLEFNPEILKRYVNFMSNPDEQTAVEQFGKDDKYFGVATLMITLPGLPMFAHGQIEGFKEKYGMEYQRAYYNETADEWLVRRHEHEIFPLTKKRFLFSQVRDFEFYDFLDDRGFVNEDVIAYSNRAGNERAVIFFHNKFADCKGYIKHSLLKATNERGDARSISVGHSLQFQSSDRILYRFRNRATNLEYLMSGKELCDRGFHIELRAFEYVVFTDFSEIIDETGEYHTIARRLNGKGTSTLDAQLREVRLLPFHHAVEKAFKTFDRSTLSHEYQNIFLALSRYTGQSFDQNSLADSFTSFFQQVDKYLPPNSLEQTSMRHTSNKSTSQTGSVLWPLYLGLYKFAYDCRTVISEQQASHGATDVFGQLQLDTIFKRILADNGEQYGTAENLTLLLNIILRHHQQIVDSTPDALSLVETVLGDFDTANFIDVNQYQDIWYYNKEQFETVIQWYLTIHSIFGLQSSTSTTRFSDAAKILHQINSASEASGYQVEKLKELVIETPREMKTKSKKMTKKGNSSKTGTKKSGTSKKKSILKKKPSSGNVKNITKRKSIR